MPSIQYLRPVAGVVLAVLVPLCAAADEDALITEGRRLYEEAAGDVGCVMCHGPKATGDADAGGPFIQGATRAQLDSALRGGVPAMDFYDLNRAEQEAILAYLQYLGHAEDVAEMDPDSAAGKVIFEETAGGVGCQACHGLDAKGDTGPDIRGQNVGAILAQLRANENMSFIKLNKTEVEQVAAYLRYLHELEPH